MLNVFTGVSDIFHNGVICEWRKMVQYFIHILLRRMVLKPFEGGVNFFVERYLHNVGAKNHKESKTFYFRALCYRSLRKSEPPHKIRLAISTEQPYDVLASRPAPVSLDLWGFVIMP